MYTLKIDFGDEIQFVHYANHEDMERDFTRIASLADLIELAELTERYKSPKYKTERKQ